MWARTNDAPINNMGFKEKISENLPEIYAYKLKGV
jgi:hypothetical protein